MPLPNNPTLVAQPFADQGDKTAPPSSDPNGFVNFLTGYTLDYEIDLNSTNANAKAVERDIQNFLFNLSTATTQFWQQMTVAPWYSDMPGGYNNGALVGRVGTGGAWNVWRSLNDDNIVDPNAGGQTAWEYVPHNSELLSQVAMPAGGGGVVMPGGQVGEIINATTDFNTLLNGTWEFASNAIANGSPHAPVQLGTASTLAGMLQSKQWTAGANTFVVQQYNDQSGNAFFRGALNGTFTAWRSVTPVSDFSVDTGAINAVQGNALLASNVIADNQKFWVNVGFANTGATTYSPTPGVTSHPVVGLGLAPLQGGELVAGTRALFVYDLANTRWILVDNSGGGVAIANASKSHHALPLGQALGRLLNVQVFSTAGVFNYVPTPGATAGLVQCQGAGGAGCGSVSVASTSNVSLGPGGHAGAYGELWIPTGLAAATVTVGAGGTGVNGGAGNAGGASSFGSLIVSQGGPSSTGTVTGIPPFIAIGGTGSPAGVSGTGSIIKKVVGAIGGCAICLNNTQSISGPGANSHLGAGGQVALSGGLDAGGNGAGGSGSQSAQGGTSAAGGKGSTGYVAVYEYGTAP